MAYEVKEMTGSFFENKDRRSDKSPDFTGNIKINGQLLRIAGWWTQSRGGEDYISMKISDPEEFKRSQSNSHSSAPSRPAGRRPMTDEEFQKERERRRANQPKPNFADDLADDDIPF